MAIGGMIVGKSFVTLMVDDTTRTITEGQPNYLQIREAIKIKDMVLVEKLINVATSVKQYMADKISIDNGQVFYGNDQVKGAVVDRIVEMMAEGFDHEPMVKFLENLMQNPSKRAVDELYGFLEDTALPITEDGHFLAYKKVRQDYKDFYTGTMDNSVGQVLEMPRNGVDEDKNRTCSAGLHFCSLSYLKHYHGNEGRVVIVKINPRDVVAIPSDYNNAKGRACRYEIIGEHTSELEEAFKKPVYSNKYYEEDDNEEEWDYNEDDSDLDEDDSEENRDDAYHEGYFRGSLDAKHGNPYYDTAPSWCDDEEEAYQEGYADGWRYTTNVPMNNSVIGYEQGRKDAEYGSVYNDNPAAHALVVNDLSAYQKAYHSGYHSI